MEGVGKSANDNKIMGHRNCLEKKFVECLEKFWRENKKERKKKWRKKVKKKWPDFHNFPDFLNYPVSLINNHFFDSAYSNLSKLLNPMFI